MKSILAIVLMAFGMVGGVAYANQQQCEQYWSQFDADLMGQWVTGQEYIVNIRFVRKRDNLKFFDMNVDGIDYVSMMAILHEVGRIPPAYVEAVAGHLACDNPDKANPMKSLIDGLGIE